MIKRISILVIVQTNQSRNKLNSDTCLLVEVTDRSYESTETKSSIIKQAAFNKSSLSCLLSHCLCC